MEGFTFDKAAQIFADIAGFIADLYAKIMEFVAGFKTSYPFEEAE